HRMLEPGLAALPSHLHMETLQTRRINGDACTYRQGLGGLHFGLMCDATGHGLTAGISTMPAIQAFLSMVARDIPLETVYREINRRIHQLMPVDRFLCLMLLRLDLRNGTLSVLNAGLPDAILQVPGTPRRRFPSRNLPAGILVTAEAPVVETAEVIPGSRLLAFTDGVLDLFPMAEAERRLMDGLDSCPLDVHRDSIKETLALAIENQEQHDDVSWALWEVPASCEAPCLAQPNPEPTSPLELDEPLTLNLAFAPQRHDIRDLVPNLVRLLAAHGLESPHDQVLALLLSEALSNAVDHGLLGLDPALRHHGAEVYRALRNLHLHAHQDGEIRLSLQFRTLPSGPIREIIVEIEDPGPGFDWRTWMQTSGRTPSAAASRGLRLIQALSRELSFNDAGNRIRFVLSCS
ncbi:MAG TPA: ATP-binding SpoIIE family protein phosphatase, partial [Holophagaceae bacterium]